MADNKPVLKPRSKQFDLFDDTSSQEGIDKAAKMGAIAGLVFATSFGFGFLFRFFGELSPITGETVALEETWIEIITFAVLVSLIVFISWRTARRFIEAAEGKCRISGDGESTSEARKT